MTRTEHIDFDRTVERHRTQVRAYCARRLSAHAVDDAVAEVFAVAWRKRSAMPSTTNALPWLYAIARRVVLHEWRRAGREARLSTKATSLPPIPVESGADHAVAAEERRLALKAAARLSGDDQEILRLTLWEELAPSDAAVVLGISTDAAKQRASRARRRLAREFNRLANAPRSTAVDAREANR